MAVVSIAVDEVAKQLYVDPGDIRVVLGTFTDEPISAARELGALCRAPQRYPVRYNTPQLHPPPRSLSRNLFSAGSGVDLSSAAASTRLKRNNP